MVLVVAAWTGVLSGVALGLQSLPTPSLPAEEAPGTVQEALQRPPTDPGLGDFSGWLGADGEPLGAPDAPLRWAVISNPAGDRLTLVMTILDRITLHILPPASLSRPGNSRALDGLAPERLLADLDLGPTEAIAWSGLRQGEFAPQRLGVRLKGATLDLGAPQDVGLGEAETRAYIQGTLPTDRLPFTGLARIDDTVLLAVHGTPGTLSHAQALFDRLGASRVAWFGDTPEREPARLYLHTARDGTGQILRRAARLESTAEPARGMTLGHARLVLQRAALP